MCNVFFVWTTAAQEVGGGGVTVRVMNECDQALAVCTPLAPYHHLHVPPPHLLPCQLPKKKQFKEGNRTHLVVVAYLKLFKIIKVTWMTENIHKYPKQDRDRTPELNQIGVVRAPCSDNTAKNLSRHYPDSSHYYYWVYESYYLIW